MERADNSHYSIAMMVSLERDRYEPADEYRFIQISTGVNFELWQILINLGRTSYLFVL